MGDPRKIRKKYQTPKHPWVATRIEEERVLTREYGLANKKEVWKMDSVLKKFKDQAKKLVAITTTQSRKEQEQMFNKLISLGLIKKEDGLDEILGLTLKDILNRRLQTILVKKNLARTMKQARQLIVHEHIVVGGKKITSPSYLVKINEESTVGFSKDSPLFREDHPERFSEEELQAKKKKEDAKKAAKEASLKEKEEDVLVIDEKELEAAEEVAEGKTKKTAKKEEAKETPKTPKEEVKKEIRTEEEKVKEKPAIKSETKSEAKPNIESEVKNEDQEVKIEVEKNSTKEKSFEEKSKEKKEAVKEEGK